MISKTHNENVGPIKDVYGLIHDMYSAESFSFTHLIIEGTTTAEKHNKSNEIYYILKGKGVIVIGNESAEISEGDMIPIPVGEFHSLSQTSIESLEVIVISLENKDTVEESRV